MAYFKTDGVALVTGATGGIGQGAANALAANGTSAVLFADIDLAQAQTAAEESKTYATNPSYQTSALQVDVADAASVEKMVQNVVGEVGQIDYLVNAAGVDTAKYMPVPDNDMDDFDRVMAINTKGMVLVSNAVAKVMLKQEPRTFKTLYSASRELSCGVIVNVTSAMSYAVDPGKIAYATSKHAALGVTKTFALDLGSKGIRVNCVCPGWGRTPMFEEACRKVPQTEDIVKSVSPLGRVAEVDEVGNSIVYPCSPAASYVNVIGLIIDAGLTLTLHLS